jgi:hypothetical protein
MDADGKIFGHWPVPPSVGLPEFVLGFPFGPSDMIIRREWIFKVDLFDKSYVHFSEDLDIYCRLALEGCQFGGLTQALNYRRYYAGRIITQAFERANAAVRALETVFADPRCPADILALRNQALGKTYLIWSHEAFLNNQTELGQEYIRKALELDPSFLENKADKLFEFIVMRGVQDAHKNDELIPRLFSQLPPELNGLQSSRDQILGRIYLVRCICEVTWNYESMDNNYFSKAAQLGAQLNKHLLGFLTFHMMNFEAEFGLDTTITSFERLTRSLAFAGRATPYFRWMMGGFLINKAHKDYRDGKYANVPSTVVKAILNNPSYLINRGVASIFVRSLIRAQSG